MNNRTRCLYPPRPTPHHVIIPCQGSIAVMVEPFMAGSLNAMVVNVLEVPCDLVLSCGLGLGLGSGTQG